jgi:DNA mismatch repair protein MutS2
MEVPLDELLPAGDPLDIRSERSVQSDLETQTRFDPKLDLRGMRPEQAETLLERFMDRALVSNTHSVQIIHGKGTGALRNLVHNKLKEYTVKEISQPVDQHGGSGTTVVSL